MTVIEREAPATPARPARRPSPVASSKRSPLRRAVNQTIVLVVALGIWEIAARLGNSIYFPPISEIAARAWELWLSGPPSTLFFTPAAADIGASLYTTVMGFLGGSALGIAIGVVIGFLPRVGAFIEPQLHFYRGIPKSALLPLFVIFLGIDDAMRIGLIIVSLAPYVALNTIEGVRSVSPVQLENCRVYGVPRRAQVIRVVLPSAAPMIFAALRFGLAVALAVMVLSEMYVANSGIGYFTILSQQTFRILDMWAGVLALGVLGNLLSIALSVVESRVLRWYRGLQGSSDD